LGLNYALILVENGEKGQSNGSMPDFQFLTSCFNYRYINLINNFEFYKIN